jgi:hypothetical protein
MQINSLIMNTRILLAAILAIVFSSCSTAYKTGQTPDDVYYSPVRADFAMLPDEGQTSYDDQSILMSIRDPRWRDFDNDYAYTPYNFGYNCDYYYNPYYCAYPVYTTIINPVNTTPRMANLSAYNNNYNNLNEALRLNKINTIQQQKTYNNSQGTGVGNFIRQVFAAPANNSYYNNANPNNNSNNNTNNNNYSDRNYEPVNNGAGSSSAGNSGGVSRPARSGRN